MLAYWLEKLKLYKDKSYKIYNNYGPTEYTVVTTSTEVTREWDNIPIGKPIDNTKGADFIKDRNSTANGSC